LRIFPAFGLDKNLFSAVYIELLNNIKSIITSKNVIMNMERKTALSCSSFDPKNKEKKIRISRPTEPLSLSSMTVATISFGFLVYAARSILRTRSPPIAEGRTRLKNIPPENEIITLDKGK